MKQIIRLSNSILLGLALAGCGGGDNNDSTSSTMDDLDDALRQQIDRLGLRGDPSLDRTLPDISDPLPQLGMKLFFSKALGGDQDSACVSCHHPVLGGGDGLTLPIGVGAVNPDLLGPGRQHAASAAHFDGSPTVPRNAPTTFNIGLWDATLFHDGRVESLGKTPEVNGDDGLGIRTPDSAFGQADNAAGSNLTAAQARFPVTSAEEMRGFEFEQGNDNQAVRQHLAGRLGNYGNGSNELAVNQWLAEFQQAFNSSADAQTLITYDAIALAIGEYQRSQVFVETPWKAYVEGDTTALSEAAKQGALLFFRPLAEGGADCAVCHSGDFFSDEGFHVLAVPQIGRGKGDGPTGDDDFGRFRETGAAADQYAFRTPTLLNVEVTAPYGHSGAYRSLENIVRHHLNPRLAVNNYDVTQLDPGAQTVHMLANTENALSKLEADQAAGLSRLPVLRLSDQQIDQLVAFLQALTDPCVKDRQCLAPWIPDAGVNDPDGLRLNALDSNSVLL